MKLVKKEVYHDKIELRANINRLADELRAGEETFTEEYNDAVKLYAKVTNDQAPARETDPIAWDAFVEQTGREPGMIRYAGGRRELNYLEMVKFNRGYWR
jgi:hypothetical protein